MNRATFWCTSTLTNVPKKREREFFVDFLARASLEQFPEATYYY